VNPKEGCFEVIVDVPCACAVLRGANVFAPGILGMPHGIYLYFLLRYVTCFVILNIFLLYKNIKINTSKKLICYFKTEYLQ
jgi:hypothetical protein